MMSKYIKIRMRPTGIGIGGAFSVPASFKLDNEIVSISPI